MLFMKSKTMKHLFCRSAWAACLMGTALLWQSCEDDTLTGQPSWLGESIYAQLESEGNYKTTLQLIDDLGLKNVLNHTGSKTVFVADDAAFEEWFRTNDWGVRSYKDLQLSQKKQLFNSAMVNNAYLVELLSNVSANPPQSGLCMRRATALSVYDTVYTISPEEMPATAAWDKHRDKSGIVLMKDNTTAPMIHFLPAFMEYHAITDRDLQIISGDSLATTADAWVNGKKIIERDITCKNGYIHKVDGVIEPTTNMAELIRKNPQTTRWSNLLDRFSAPYYDENTTKEYNRLYQNKDSVFVLRYYSEVSANSAQTSMTPDGEVIATAELLPFDPGWNQYMYVNTSGYDMHYDAGLMIVPTDEVLEYWFHEGEGKALKDQFGCWDSIPQKTLRELVAVNMVESFTDRVPSKFDNVLNDAQMKLGIKPENVVHSEMGCNGVVFTVNKVFTPSAYSSVTFPALIRENTLGVIYWAIDNLEFLPYLNSMESDYSLLLPTNNSMLCYLDPANYGEVQQTMLEFYYDETEKKVKARRYNCTVENGQIIKGTLVQPNVAENVVLDRLEDLIDQLIVVGLVEEGGYQYYKTKGGTMLSVLNNGTKFQGGWQIENNVELPVSARYPEANGVSYELSGQMPFGATKSVYATLNGVPEYEAFLSLLLGGDPDAPKQNMLIASMGTTGQYKCGAAAEGNYNMALFDNYNYTVYVPSNEAIQELINKGILPTWDDFNQYYAVSENPNATDEELAEAQVYRDVIVERITNFIRYHVQDNSVAINGAPALDVDGNKLITNDYESMMINQENGRFYPLQVTSEKNSLTILDGAGQRISVDTTPGFYNQLCREYWFQGSSFNRQIYMESDAVVHRIKGALRYAKDEVVGSWKTEAERRWWDEQNK